MFGGGGGVHLHKEDVICDCLHFDAHGKGTLGEDGGLHEVFLR